MFSQQMIYDIQNKTDFHAKRSEIILRTGLNVVWARTRSCLCRIYPRRATYPVESCNTGLCTGISVHVHIYVHTETHLERGKEYFITIRQIMLNVLRFHRVRAYAITWISTECPLYATNYTSLDMALLRDVLVPSYTMFQKCYHTFYAESL